MIVMLFHCSVVPAYSALLSASQFIKALAPTTLKLTGSVTCSRPVEKKVCCGISVIPSLIVAFFKLVQVVNTLLLKVSMLPGIVTSIIPAPENAIDPMDFSDSPNVSFVRLFTFWNARSPILMMLARLASVIGVPTNPYPPMLST